MKTKKQILNRILRLVLALVMVLVCRPMTAFAADTVTYIECSWNDNSVVKTTKEVTDYTVVTSGTTTMNEGWYVVNSDVTVSDQIIVEGNTNLILMDGCTLTASKGISYVSNGKSFNIYGQENGTGALVATANHAGRSGIRNSGHMAVHGANVTAKGGDSSGKGNGAGIEVDYWVNGTGALVIYDGVITATGSSYYSWNGCAGIGSIGTNDASMAGYPSGDIDIYGGIIFATGKNGADDIGSGMGGKGLGTKDVTISGGLIFDHNGNGVLGGMEYTLEKDWEIPAGKTLTIESGKTLIISEGVTLTRTGTLVNNGTIVTVCSDSTEYDGTVKYVHDDLTYSVNEDTITATCSRDNSQTFSVTLAIDAYSIEYDGNAHGATVKDVDSNWVNTNLELPIITYSKKQADGSWGTPTSDKPVDVGIYQATITVDGNKITKTFEIMAVKSTITEPTISDNPADITSPNTGDNSNMFRWIALLFISGGAVIILTVVDKKRRMASKR